ncbi:Long-chain-fatty-acid--CoA ligase 2 [Hypsizygus marmoreus]|uniref:Long-chain-fatty-acid--CoA ligase 2 n=1 Tax=Hypsizygus marmoreus TaxID=39966 RepID=A0A369K3Z9_HYPMA|nr:Long-chain-fatty-acid--CoA ligase 2 [Hypsizygus marmoreus]
MSSRMPMAKPGYFGCGSSEVASAANSGEGPARRLAITCDRLITQPVEGVDTVLDVLQYAARKHGANRALGWRDVIDVHEEKKETKKVIGGKEVTEVKTWKYFELSDYRYISYVDFEGMVGDVARALLDLGFLSEHVFNIYAQTSVNWQLMAHACSSISTAIATAYDTLGESGLAHSLNEPECIGLFTNADLLKIVSNVLPNTPTVKYVIYDGTPSPTHIASIQALRGDLKILSIAEVLAHGKSLPDSHLLDSRRPNKNTLACIMYTSGSTGPPKGVCITHSNLIASVASVSMVFGHHLPKGGTYLAYLPLAHVLEYIVELCALFVGVTSGYARPKTLTDASVRNCLGDLNAFRPNIMFGVPAVWETIKKGILGKIAAGGKAKQMAFEGAMSLKKAGVPVLAGLADSVVLSKVREATGGQLQFTMNGGAAISRDTQEFLSLAVVPMMQGYGMTESCGMCTLLPPELMQYGVVGLPVPSIEIKLLDVPHAGYTSSGTGPQRGEVCIRGPSVTKGYYKRPDLNSDETVFTKDGWLRTGDVGQWNEDGTLSIIDRIKNLVKLASGEYIALESLESIYKSCHLVSNLCVYASPSASRPIAIIIPHEANLRHALAVSEHGAVPPNVTLADLCKDRDVQDLILSECNAVGKKQGFKPAEILHAVVLTPDEWTPGSGLVTPAMKIQRAKIGKVFEQEIEVHEHHPIQISDSITDVLQ